MSIFRFVSVKAWEPLICRKGLLAQTTLVNRLATENSKAAEMNAVVPECKPKAYHLLSRKQNSSFTNDYSSHKTDEEISKTLSDKQRTLGTVSVEMKDIHNAALKKLPRKPPGLFGLFVKENYSKIKAEMIPGISTREVMPALSKKWRNLPNKEKERLKQKQHTIQERYKQEVLSFWKELTTEERAYLDEKQGPKMRQLAKDRRHLLGYPKSPSSPFILFVQRSAEGLKSASAIERAKMLGQKWKKMSAEDKEEYFEENRKAHAQHKKDIAKWKEEHSEVA